LSLSIIKKMSNNSLKFKPMNISRALYFSAVVSLFISSALLSGCAGSRAPSPTSGETSAASVSPSREEPSAVARYTYNRFADFFDIIELGAGVGLAVRAEAHVTQYARLGAGLGLLATLVLNPEGTRNHGYHSQFFLELPVGLANQNTSWPNSVIYLKHNVKEGPGYDPGEAFEPSDYDPWSIGASASLLLVGVQASVYPVELLDWLVGWAGYDLTGDDWTAPPSGAAPATADD
jgi:hypothetical protein